jgi:hypothetical protein
MSNQRLWRRGSALGAASIAAVAAVVLFGGGRRERASRAPAIDPATARGAGGRAVAAGGVARSPHKPGLGLCGRDLARFDADVTLATFRHRAAALVAGGDPLILEYLADRLAELIGDDEARGREVIGWAASADADELWLLLDGLGRSAAAARPAVADELARVALDPALDGARRAAFLAALDGRDRLALDTLDGLAAIALVDEPGDSGWVAARTVGRVMATEVAQGGDAAPYLDRLLAIGAASPDAHVRSVALEMPMHADVPVDTAAASRLAAILGTDPDPDVRKVAIHDLSMAVDRDGALIVYEEAFRIEHDVCVRWALFRFAARLAGARALPAMSRMAAVDPRFAADVVAFQRIYDSGVVDFERVWASLPDDDPHHCLLSEEEELQ